MTAKTVSQAAAKQQDNARKADDRSELDRLRQRVADLEMAVNGRVKES